MMIRKFVYSSLFYFLLISMAGLILRWKFIYPILPSIEFDHLIHAHSHVAFLGWVYFILLAFFYQFILKEETKQLLSTRIVYYLLHISVIGMFISFSLQGYGLYSIIFSSIHGLLSYFFVFQYWKYHTLAKGGPERILFHGAVFYMFFSSLGPFGVAAANAMGYGKTSIPNLFIYFYLHFQYNGWFTLAIIGMGYWLLNKYGIAYHKKLAKWQAWLAILAVVPTYLGSVLWYPHKEWVDILSMLGGVLYMVSVGIYSVLFLPLLKRNIFSKGVQLLFYLSFTSLMVKAMMEAFGQLSFIASMIYSDHQVIIGYLHLTLLGFISSFLLAFLFHNAEVSNAVSRRFNLYAFLYTVGSVSMVFFLFLLGLGQWASLTLPLHLIMVMILVTSVAVLLAVAGVFLSAFHIKKLG